MQLVAYEHNNQRSTGILSDAGVGDLPQASHGPIPGDMLSLLQGGEAMLTQAQEVGSTGEPIPVSEIQLRAPIAN